MSSYRSRPAAGRTTPLTTAQSTHLIQRFMQHFPNQQWDRNQLAHLLTELDTATLTHPRAPKPLPPPQSIVANLLTKGTGQELAARSNARRPVAHSQPSTSRSRQRTVPAKSRKGSTSHKFERECSRSRSPHRVISPPDSPHPIHPSTDRGDIHPHAFIVPSSMNSCPIHASEMACCTRCRDAANYRKNEARKQQEFELVSKQNHRDRGVQAAPLIADDATSISSGVEEKAYPIELTGRVKFDSNGIKRVANTTTQTAQPEIVVPPPAQPLRAAGLPTASISKREGQRVWMIDHGNFVPSGNGNIIASNTAPTPPRRRRSNAAPITYSTESYVAPVRSNHNAHSFNVFQHEGQENEEDDDDEIEAKQEHTSSYREISERIKAGQYPVETTKAYGVPHHHTAQALAWEKQQASLLASYGAYQSRVNAETASRNASRTRPVGDVAWWPNEYENEVDQHEEVGVDERVDRRQEQRKKKLSVIEMKPAGLERKEEKVEVVVKKPVAKKKVSAPSKKKSQQQYEQPPQRPASVRSNSRSASSKKKSAAAPYQPHFSVVAAPQHRDRAASARARSKSPYPADLPSASLRTYAQTFRPSYDVQPLPYGNEHEQHRYDLHHRNDSEVSVGEYSFKNRRGGSKMKEEIKKRREEMKRMREEGKQNEDVVYVKQQPDYRQRSGASAVPPHYSHLSSSSRSATGGARMNELDEQFSRLNKQHTQFQEEHQETNEPEGDEEEHKSVEGSSNDSLGTPAETSDYGNEESDELQRQHMAQYHLKHILAQQRADEIARMELLRAQRSNVTYPRVAFNEHVATYQSPAHNRTVDSSISSVLELAKNPMIKAFAAHPYATLPPSSSSRPISSPGRFSSSATFESSRYSQASPSRMRASDISQISSLPAASFSASQLANDAFAVSAASRALDAESRLREAEQRAKALQEEILAMRSTQAQDEIQRLVRAQMQSSSSSLHPSTLPSTHRSAGEGDYVTHLQHQREEADRKLDELTQSARNRTKAIIENVEQNLNNAINRANDAVTRQQQQQMAASSSSQFNASALSSMSSFGRTYHGAGGSSTAVNVSSHGPSLNVGVTFSSETPSSLSQMSSAQTSPRFGSSHLSDLSSTSPPRAQQRYESHAITTSGTRTQATTTSSSSTHNRAPLPDVTISDEDDDDLHDLSSTEGAGANDISTPDTLTSFEEDPVEHKEL